MSVTMMPGQVQLAVMPFRRRDIVRLAGGLQKVAAIQALLRTGIVRGLVIDGDAAKALED